MLEEFAFTKAKDQSPGDTVVCYECETNVSEKDSLKVFVWAKESSIIHHSNDPINKFEHGKFNLHIAKDHSWYSPSYTISILTQYNCKSDIMAINVKTVYDILVAIGAKRVGDKSSVANGGVCAKCGMYDDYASYTEQFGEVRCFRHCC
jgi:hypothetical protein